MADYGNILLEAVQTVVDGNLEKLQFDKTITAIIVDNSLASQGEYSVNDGSSTFSAYSDNTSYTKGTSVYISIPNNDFTQQKIIIGKYIVDKGESYTFNNSWEKFIDVTNNVVNLDSPKSITANSEETEKTIISPEYFEENHVNYEYLGLRADFRTLCSSAVTGTYGIRLYVRTKGKNENLYKTHLLELSSLEMLGNPYNFETYYTQEKLFDISKFDDIYSIQVTLFQNGDFYNKNNKELAISQQGDNIFVDNIYLAFGYNTENFEGNDVYFYSLENEIYGSQYGSEGRENQKTLKLRWIDKDEDGNINIYSENSNLDDKARIHWYKYKLDAQIDDEIAGKFWEEQLEWQNSFVQNINCYDYINEQNVRFKVIVETPIKEKILVEYAENEEIGKAEQELRDRELDLENRKVEYEVDGSEMSEAEYNLAKDAYEIALKNYNDITEIYTAKVNYLESDIISFTNEVRVADPATLDLIQALSLSVDEEGYGGSYAIYLQDNNIQNNSEANKLRNIVANFNSLVTGEQDLDQAAAITWKFPLHNTMIKAPELGKEYTEEDEVTYDESGDYCYITRSSNNISGNLGELYEEVSIQGFRIKNYYTANATNNIITCIVKKNQIIYTAEADLFFGPLGNNGTNYTFTLNMESDRTCLYRGDIAPVRIDASLYDYSNNITNFDASQKIVYSWYSQDEETKVGFCNANGLLYDSEGGLIMEDEDTSLDGWQLASKYIVKGDNEDTSCYIRLLSKAETGKEDVEPTPMYYILQAKVSVDSEVDSNNKVSLISYLPIAFSTDYNYTHIVGADKIIYDSAGSKCQYYKDNYILYSGNDEISSTEWTLTINNSNKNDFGYYPKISKENKLIPAPIYVNDLDRKIAVQAINEDGEILWIQPLIIYQNAYFSTLLNTWNGGYTVDEDAGTIMSSMVGAGYKDESNRFNGVLMGNVKKLADPAANTGLFGYHEGTQSFGFKTDGTAFIGKANKGQIRFDGNHGSITSLSFEENNIGMNIDLDDGLIEMRGGKIEALYKSFLSKEITLEELNKAKEVIFYNKELEEIKKDNASFKREAGKFTEADLNYIQDNTYKVELKLASSLEYIIKELQSKRAEYNKLKTDYNQKIKSLDTQEDAEEINSLTGKISNIENKLKKISKAIALCTNSSSNKEAYELYNNLEPEVNTIINAAYEAQAYEQQIENNEKQIEQDKKIILNKVNEFENKLKEYQAVQEEIDKEIEYIKIQEEERDKLQNTENSEESLKLKINNLLGSKETEIQTQVDKYLVAANEVLNKNLKSLKSEKIKYETIINSLKTLLNSSYDSGSLADQLDEILTELGNDQDENIVFQIENIIQEKDYNDGAIRLFDNLLPEINIRNIFAGSDEEDDDNIKFEDGEEVIEFEDDGEPSEEDPEPSEEDPDDDDDIDIDDIIGFEEDSSGEGDEEDFIPEEYSDGEDDEADDEFLEISNDQEGSEDNSGEVSEEKNYVVIPANNSGNDSDVEEDEYLVNDNNSDEDDNYNNDNYDNDILEIIDITEEDKENKIEKYSSLKNELEEMEVNLIKLENILSALKAIISGINSGDYTKESMNKDSSLADNFAELVTASEIDTTGYKSRDELLKFDFNGYSKEISQAIAEQKEAIVEEKKQIAEVKAEALWYQYSSYLATYNIYINYVETINDVKEKIAAITGEEVNEDSDLTLLLIDLEGEVLPTLEEEINELETVIKIFTLNKNEEKVSQYSQLLEYDLSSFLTKEDQVSIMKQFDSNYLKLFEGKSEFSVLTVLMEQYIQLADLETETLIANENEKFYIGIDKLNYYTSIFMTELREALNLEVNDLIALDSENEKPIEACGFRDIFNLYWIFKDKEEENQNTSVLRNKIIDNINSKKAEKEENENRQNAIKEEIKQIFVDIKNLIKTINVITSHTPFDAPEIEVECTFNDENLEEKIEIFYFSEYKALENYLEGLDKVLNDIENLEVESSINKLIIENQEIKKKINDFTTKNGIVEKARTNMEKLFNNTTLSNGSALKDKILLTDKGEKWIDNWINDYLELNFYDLFFTTLSLGDFANTDVMYSYLEQLDLLPGYTPTQSAIRLSTLSPYLTIRGSGEDSRQDLIHIADDKFYLQTADYQKESTEDNYGKGLKIDLKEGNIDGYNFNLKATNSTKGDPYAKSYIQINSDGDPYLRVHHENSKENYNLDILDITKDKFALRSHNWKNEDSGMEINLAKESIKMYGKNNTSITFEANKSSELLNITASNGKSILNVGSKYYLQSSNFVDNKSGMKIDLSNGFIKAFGRFNLDIGTNNSRIQMYAKQVTENEKERERVSFVYKGDKKPLLTLDSSIEISSNRLKDGEEELSGEYKEKFILRSANSYNNKYSNATSNWSGQGLKIDVTAGTIEGESLYIKKSEGQVTINGKSYNKFMIINSDRSRGDSPIMITGLTKVQNKKGESDQYSTFEVTWNGELKATGGVIGNFHITENSIYTGSNYPGGNGLYFGSQGLGVGSGDFVVDSGGKLTASAGTIGGWKISRNALTAPNSGGELVIGSMTLDYKGIHFGSTNGQTGTMTFSNGAKLEFKNGILVKFVKGNDDNLSM